MAPMTGEHNGPNNVVRFLSSATPADLAANHSLRDLDEWLLGAVRAGNDERAEIIRRALMLKVQRDLASLEPRLDPYLRGVGRGTTWTTWIDEGLVAWRIRVEMSEPAPPSADLPIIYWVTEGDDDFTVMHDRTEADQPTPFARRNAQRFAATSDGIAQIHHLIAAQVTVWP